MNDGAPCYCRRIENAQARLQPRYETGEPSACHCEDCQAKTRLTPKKPIPAGARNGREGYPYGFSVTTEEGKPLVSFAYASRALAEVAATHLESALLNAISVHPYAE